MDTNEMPAASHFAKRAVISLVVVLVLVFLFVTYAIHYTSLPDFDRRIAETMRDHADENAAVRGLFVVITELGGVTALGVLAAMGVLWSCAIGRFRLAAAWLLIVLSGSLLNVGIKTLVDRRRPPEQMRDKAVNESNESFPSGHAMGSAIGFGMVGFAVYGMLRTRFRRVAVVSALIIVILMIGFSRVYLRAHWFSDVIAGLALGAAWVVGWYWFFAHGVAWIRDGKDTS